jgi:lipocalin
MGNSASSLPALQTVANCETSKFMGTWFVVGVKPTMFEKTCSNAVERYTLVHGKNHDVDIDFQYNNKEAITSPLDRCHKKGGFKETRKTVEFGRSRQHGPSRCRT